MKLLPLLAAIPLMATPAFASLSGEYHQQAEVERTAQLKYDQCLAKVEALKGNTEWVSYYGHFNVVNGVATVTTNTPLSECNTLERQVNVTVDKTSADGQYRQAFELRVEGSCMWNYHKEGLASSWGKLKVKRELFAHKAGHRSDCNSSYLGSWGEGWTYISETRKMEF